MISRRTWSLTFPEKTHEKRDLLNTGVLAFFMISLSSAVYESIEDDETASVEMIVY
jgi:hypothetical protein